MLPSSVEAKYTRLPWTRRASDVKTAPGDTPAHLQMAIYCKQQSYYLKCIGSARNAPDRHGKGYAMARCTSKCSQHLQ